MTFTPIMSGQATKPDTSQITKDPARTHSRRRSSFAALLAAFALTLTGCTAGANPSGSQSTGSDSGTAQASQPGQKAQDGENKEAGESAPEHELSREGYTLEQTVVLSRHNIRSPLSGKGSALESMTPHTWHEWSSDPSDLSLRGGVLEAENGQFFRKWLEAEGLFPEDYQPADGEVRIYANSKQRTIATANFFLAGLLPVADVEVEHHGEFDTMDPVFNPQFTYMSDSYRDAAKAQVKELFTPAIEALAEDYKLLGYVIDVEDSQAVKDGSFTEFATDDTELEFENGKEPAMSGSLKTATSISDALVLQYYESDDANAAFGKKLSEKDWEDVAHIKDVYQDVLFTAPTVAANVAHPLLQEILGELSAENRKFTFLCGHDSNLGSVLAALGADEYELPNAIEKKTPIGSKVVFSRWRDAEGKRFISIDLVYQSVDQLRGLALLDMDNPPLVEPLTLSGLEANDAGLYEASAVEDRLREAIAEYDELATKHP